MKKVLFLILALLTATAAFPQHRLTYQSYTKGANENDTAYTFVIQRDSQIAIVDGSIVRNSVPGLSEIKIVADYAADSVYYFLNYPDESYFATLPFSNDDVTLSNEGKEKVLGYSCMKYKAIVNSNTIEIWMTTEPGFQATVAPTMGKLDGVMVRRSINGSYITDLKSIKTDKKPKDNLIPDQKGVRVGRSDLNQIRKNRLVVRIPVFTNEQINFADYPSFQADIPFDTTIHFASGTMIVKKMRIPRLPEHYRIFAEIHHTSNGDAYDRAASVFVIPTERQRSLLDGMRHDVDSLPIFVGKDGRQYQGIMMEDDYLPAIELVRFFTSFGVGLYNDKVKIDSLRWADEDYYKEDVTDLRDRLGGDVLIGAFIGNYDKGGHHISMDLVAYPEDYEWGDTICRHHSVPLFNTCNELEMAGQNYGRLFGTDTLAVAFELPENATNVRLRYIATGHGGWDGGDEFNPKENTIRIDSDVAFRYTPWRCDCATFRDQNPASGNFWNGLTSSDYSRSGWCPGTAAQPAYFDLHGLKPGKHVISISIPQGADEGGSFSHWMVSGVLMYDEKP